MRHTVIPAKYVFSQPLAFATIPKAYGFEAATHFPPIILGGSLIPIDVYRDGDGFSVAKHIPREGGNPAKSARVALGALIINGIKEFTLRHLL